MSIILGINDYHVSGHCWKGFQSQRSKVKVTARTSAVHFCRGGLHFDDVASTIILFIAVMGDGKGALDYARSVD